MNISMELLLSLKDRADICFVWKIMPHLNSDGGFEYRTLQDIAYKIGCTYPYVITMVNKLERNGVVKRIHDGYLVIYGVNTED